MRKWVHLFLIFSTVVLLSSKSVLAEVSTGESAPNFTLTDTKGQPHSLMDFKGKFVVLEWFNSDCPFVKKHYDSHNIPGLQKMYMDKGVIWLTINSSAQGKEGYYPPQEFEQIINKKDAHPTAALLDSDGKVGKLFGAQTTPHMFIINPDGVLIYQGAIDSMPSTDPADLGRATNYVQQALDEAMAGTAVRIPATKAYGCSVKY